MSQKKEREICECLMEGNWQMTEKIFIFEDHFYFFSNKTFAIENKRHFNTRVVKNLGKMGFFLLRKSFEKFFILEL